MGGVVLVLVCMAVVWVVICKKKKKKKKKKKGGAEVAEGEVGVAGGGGEEEGGFAWENEGVGKLVFCGGGDREMSYSLEELLKASAETLGRGIVGSTYKAVMESGFIVTVKRLKDARYPALEEFRAHIQVLGSLTHPNLVPLRAYFQAKEERLLVYDYFPNGSLFSLIHGTYSFLLTSISPPQCYQLNKYYFNLAYTLRIIKSYYNVIVCRGCMFIQLSNRK